MSSGQSLMEAFLIWVIMIIMAFILAIAILMPWDVLLSVMQMAGMDDVGASWDTTGDRGMLSNLMLVVVYILPILGGINFVATAVRRQEYDESVYQP